MSVIQIPRILLPARTDAEAMRKWSVIACDQFTSDKKYWEALEREVGEAPSTLRLVFPEVYLDDGDAEARIAAIRQNMRGYLADGVFRRLDRGFVLVERSTRYTDQKRYGVVLAIDLEEYSFQPRSSAKIRATEATVPERIPPRVKIRRGAPLELPHVMLLYDAREEEILKDLENGRPELLYDFELNRGGGRLRGWFLPEEQAAEIAQRLYATAGDMLFAVGDGNHSLAAAKTCWEEIKATLSPEERRTHPARYALCEAVSLYSPALTFEPIHRFVDGVAVEKFIAGIGKYVSVPMRREGRTLSFTGEYDAVSLLRSLDAYIAEYTGMYGGKTDYIHGEKELAELTDGKKDSVGIRLKTVSKDGFFKAVEEGGSLPRKTFSMGEGAEKRYYTECREISAEYKEF